MAKAYLWFMADINQQTAASFIGTLFNIAGTGASDLCLLLSTGGGGSYQALTMYNALRSMPFNIETVNVGLVESNGLILYCAGQTRLSVPNARFGLHPFTWTLNGTFGPGQFREYSDKLEWDQENYAAVLADTTGKDPMTIRSDMAQHRILTPTEAQAYGLVTSVRDVKIPKDAPRFLIT